MNARNIFAVGASMAVIAFPSHAQTPQPHKTNVALYSFYLRDAPLDMTLERLQELTGKSITVDLGLAASVTISTPDKVTADEAVALITQALDAQGIRLEPLDENTLRVRGTPKPKPPPVHFENREAAMKRIAELKAQRQTVRSSAPIATNDFSYWDRRRARMAAAGRTNSVVPSISETDRQGAPE